MLHNLPSTDNNKISRFYIKKNGVHGFLHNILEAFMIFFIYIMKSLRDMEALCNWSKGKKVTKAIWKCM